MRFSQDELVTLLRLAGRHDEVDPARLALPDQVGSSRHGELLAELGLDLHELLRPTGGPNLSDRLGNP
ncbi:MAG: ClpB protein [uncultured Friedmanniella sp.]|uniref:ClpB protein n=1 Tax=uncultured Friedmanniella sp. TaxID=335381 RepID=A0A6J4LGL8_9ACTN|nr:MAG: ClpB protein [uncultured Friedmanniella sp.]